MAEYQWHANWRGGLAWSAFDSLEKLSRRFAASTLWVANNITPFSRYLLQYEKK